MKPVKRPPSKKDLKKPSPLAGWLVIARLVIEGFFAYGILGLWLAFSLAWTWCRKLFGKSNS